MDRTISEDRLLTGYSLYFRGFNLHFSDIIKRRIFKDIVEDQLAKDLEWEAKTASIKDAEIKRLKEDHERELQMFGEDFRDKCQQRVKRIFKEIERNAFSISEGESELTVGEETIKWQSGEEVFIIMSREKWQVLKKQEGIAE